MMRLDELPGRGRGRDAAGHLRVADDQGTAARHDGDRKPFRYRDLGSMATISRFRAVVSFKGIRVAGFLGWLMWLFVHLAFMTGFKNRFITVVQWGLAFIGKGRSERTLTLQQAVARVAIEEAGGGPSCSASPLSPPPLTSPPRRTRERGPPPSRGGGRPALQSTAERPARSTHRGPSSECSYRAPQAPPQQLPNSPTPVATPM